MKTFHQIALVAIGVVLGTLGFCFDLGRTHSFSQSAGAMRWQCAS